ncbi:hypothetical protein [Enterococcus casseliflavus]|uniref:hypothetical protein n=1 Tax=Enterococcus casseliflavus TaxID=37734 RepID=UPI0023312FA8|nr:hypothetical protein [Enterococcus casseliflavus]MDB1687490.1 hypothetical protein [Enterococcus casseliflavus]
MGTLFDQQPRRDYLSVDRVISFGEDMQEIAKELNISLSEAVELYLAVAKINDYDTKDEQLSGFGEILQSLVQAIENKDN